MSVNNMRMLLTVATIGLALSALGQAQSGRVTEGARGKGSGKSKGAAAQSSAAPAGPIPRGADGKPNLSGIFSTVAGVRERQEPIAFQPWAEKKHAEFVARQRV